MADGSQSFFWSGVDNAGNRVAKRQIFGPSREAVIAALVRDGHTPVKVQLGGDLSRHLRHEFRTGRLKWSQKADLARRLYQMLRAGISQHQALLSLAEDAKPDVAKICRELAENVMAGQTLAASMRKHPNTFDEVFCAYVEAGEASGTLPQSMERLAVLLAKRATMQAKIKSALAYPMFTGGLVAIIVVGIMLFVVPMFEKMYAGFGAKLPGPTLALVWVSNHLLPFRKGHLLSMPIPVPAFTHIMSIVLYFVIAWIVFRIRTRDNLAVGVFLDKVKFKMPLMGKISVRNAVFRWASTLSGARQAGVGTPRALELSAAASGSRWIVSLTPQMMEAIRTGRNLSSVLAEYPALFPTMVRTLLSTGEMTGEVVDMLDGAARTLHEEVDELVARMSARVENLTVAILGGVAGTIIGVLYLPILHLATAASKGLGS